MRKVKAAWWRVSLRDTAALLTNYLDGGFHKMKRLKKKRRETTGAAEFLQTHLCSKCLVDNLHRV